LGELKVATFTVRATREQARRWALVARWLKCRSVGAWLEEMADEASERLEEVAAASERYRPFRIRESGTIRSTMSVEFKIGVIVKPDGNDGTYLVHLEGQETTFKALFGFPISATFPPQTRVILLFLAQGQRPAILGRAPA